MLRNFTRGGQISTHRFRMLSQNLFSMLRIFLIASLMFFSFKTYKDTHHQDWFCVREYLYADLMLSIPFSDPQNTKQEVAFPGSKEPKTLKSIDIIRNPFISKKILWVEYLLKRNLTQSTFFGLLCSLLAMFYFITRGWLHFKKDIKRGTKFLPSTSVARRVRWKRLDSDLKLDSLPLIKNKETSHILITGTTGSGKTNCFHTLLPQIRKRKNRAIVVDLTGDFVAKYYNPLKDIILNPFDERSSNWSLWDECQTDSQFDVFAEACISQESKAFDPFWDDAGSKVLSTAIKKLKEQDIFSPKELFRILVQASLEEYHAFFKGTDAAPFTDIKGDKTTTSVRATLARHIQFLRYLEESPENRFSIRKWISQEDTNQWIFLTARADQRKALKPFISSIFDVAMNALMTLHPDQERRVWFIVDELPSLQQLPSLDTGLAEIRKYGGCILAGIQNIPQLSNIYGEKKSRSLLDLFNTFIFFRNNEPSTTKWISTFLGEAEVNEINENFSYGSNTMRDGVSLNTHTNKQTLVLPTEVSNLKDLECFVKLPGNFPVTKLSISYKNKESIAQSFLLKKEISLEEPKIDKEGEDSILERSKHHII